MKENFEGRYSKGCFTNARFDQISERSFEQHDYAPNELSIGGKMKITRNICSDTSLFVFFVSR